MQQVHQALGAHNIILNIRLPDEDPVLDALGHYQVSHPSHAVHIVEVHLQGPGTPSTPDEPTSVLYQGHTTVKFSSDRGSCRHYGFWVQGFCACLVGGECRTRELPGVEHLPLGCIMSK